MKKPRLGKKGRKALAAKKIAKRGARKAKAAKKLPAPEPRQEQEQEAPELPPLAASAEESGVGDECAVGGTCDAPGSIPGAEFRTA